MIGLTTKNKGDTLLEVIRQIYGANIHTYLGSLMPDHQQEVRASAGCRLSIYETILLGMHVGRA
jgi:hypothetical protein